MKLYFKKFGIVVNKNIIKTFLIWLTILLIVGLFSTHLSSYKEGTCNIKNQLPYYRWDSFWYTSISRHGYNFSEVKNSSIAFFPFYPMVIRLVHFVSRVREDYVSLGLNVVFSFMATLFLYRLAKIDYSEKISLVLVVMFLFFPPAYFFLSGYPDILFALLAILSLYFSRKKEWGKAGIVAGLLAITKPYGIFMLPAILLEYLWSYDWKIETFWKKSNWLPLLLPLLSFGAFVVFNYLKFHDPVAFLDTQKTWGRSLANPAVALLEECKHYLFGRNIFSGSNFPYVIYLGSFIFSLWAFAISWSRVRRTYLLSALLTGTLTSWGRYMLLGFPVLIGPAIYFSERKKLLMTYFIISVLAMIISASFFVRCFPFE